MSVVRSCRIPREKSYIYSTPLMMIPIMLFKVLVISLASSFWLRTVTSKAILTHNKEYDDQSEDFEIGEPLTDQELNSVIAIKAGEYESEEFIPWTQQDPELFGGDIKLTERKNALMSSKARWPSARIPYVLASNYTPRQREIIGNAISTYHNLTCVRFVPRTTERNYIRIKKTGQGCWSFVGRIGRRQTVSLDDKCILYSRPGLVIHELMHVLGFYHEHQRPDRDRYVTVNLDNVEPKNKRYFEKMRISHFNILGHTYDYGSVMHYPKDAFAKDLRKPVITPLEDDTSVLGNRKSFSAIDLEKLNALYCSSTEV